MFLQGLFSSGPRTVTIFGGTFSLYLVAGLGSMDFLTTGACDQFPALTLPWDLSFDQSGLNREGLPAWDR